MAESKSAAYARSVKGNSELSRSVLSLKTLSNSRRSEWKPSVTVQRDDGKWLSGWHPGASGPFHNRQHTDAVAPGGTGDPPKRRYLAPATDSKYTAAFRAWTAEI